MKTNVLISFLLLACVDAIGQQQDRLLHYETERAIYVYPDNPGYRDATPLTNAYRQEDLTDEEWEEQKHFINSITEQVLTKEEINALEHSWTYTGNQVFLILDGNGMIVDVSFRCLKSDRSILTDEKLQKYIALLKGRKVNLKIFPKQGNSYPRSEWRAYHPLGLYTYSFE